jgi:ferredoxin
MTDAITIEIDTTTCVGSVECMRRLPDVFLLDDHEGQAVAMSPQHADRRSDLEAVAAVCPTGSIRLTVVDPASGTA